MARPKGSGRTRTAQLAEVCREALKDWGMTITNATAKFEWASGPDSIPMFEIYRAFKPNEYSNPGYVRVISYSLYQYAKQINWPRAEELHPNNQYYDEKVPL